MNMAKYTVRQVEFSLVTKCLDICQVLTRQGKTFTFNLSFGSNFTFTLYSRVKSSYPERIKKKLSPSVIRRNSRRKVEYLKKKSDVSNESDNYLEVKTPSQDVIAFCVTNATTQPAEK